METLLVGNSLLRDVHFDGPDNRSQIRVVKTSGATFKEIEQMIDEADMLDMHVMSAIASASVALTRENVCPRVVD